MTRVLYTFHITFHQNQQHIKYHSGNKLAQPFKGSKTLKLGSCIPKGQSN